jgi:hypothetical protein
MSTFSPGQRVRCIDGKFDSFVREFVDKVPVEGGVYTIREICFEASGWEAGNVAPGFFFEEIPEGLPGLEGRICWEAQRFDPIVDADEAEKRTAKRPRSRRKKSLTICTNRHPIVA